MKDPTMLFKSGSIISNNYKYNINLSSPIFSVVKTINSLNTFQSPVDSENIFANKFLKSRELN